MNEGDLVYLDDGAQEAYMAFQRRFETADWKAMVEWAEERATAAGVRQLAAATWDQTLLAKGARQAFLEIVNLETDVENQFISLVAEARELSISAAEGANE
jgi:hypothetical protein